MSAVSGEAGGELVKCIELGREGEARGTMSRGSDPAKDSVRMRRWLT